MKQTNIWSYIWVGTCLRYLQDQRAGIRSHDSGGTMDNLRGFFSSLEGLSLHVTRRASGKLLKLQKELEAKPKEYALSNDDASQLVTAASEIRQTFQAEAQGIFCYAVTDKRLDVKKLLEGVDALFAPGVYELLPEVARFDYSESGRCIAFELATAAAFHVLRATEDVIRIYYRRHIRPAQPRLTWGQMTTALRQKSRGKRPDPIILNQLDHIRTAFRNPTQHPDKLYDIQEAQDLFGLCVDVVNRMSVVIKKH